MPTLSGSPGLRTLWCWRAGAGWTHYSSYSLLCYECTSRSTMYQCTMYNVPETSKNNREEQNKGGIVRKGRQSVLCRIYDDVPICGLEGRICLYVPVAMDDSTTLVCPDFAVFSDFPLISFLWCCISFFSPLRFSSSSPCIVPSCPQKDSASSHRKAAGFDSRTGTRMPKGFSGRAWAERCFGWPWVLRRPTSNEETP